MGTRLAFCNPAVPPRLDWRTPIPANTKRRKIKKSLHETRISASLTLRKREKRFPIFSAQITVAFPEAATEELMKNGEFLIVNDSSTEH